MIMHDNAIQFLLHCSTFHCAVPGLLKCCMLCIRLVWFRSLMHLGRAPNIDNWLLCLAWVGNFWSRSVLLKHPAQSCFLIDPASENPTNSWQRCATCEKKISCDTCWPSTLLLGSLRRQQQRLRQILDTQMTAAWQDDHESSHQTKVC